MIGLCPRMCWHRIAAAAAAAAAAFREGRDLPASWRQRFPDARLKIHLRFNAVRILWALLGIFHGRLWRFETQIIEVLFLLAQWWTVIHIPRLVKFKQNTLKHSMIVLLLMIVPIWALNPASSISSRSSCTAPSSGLDNFHTWDCSFEHSLECTCTYVHTWDCSREYSPGCTRTFGCGGCPSMQQSGLPLPFVLCVFFMTSFHFFSIVALASGINIAWGERSFIYTSRLPETDLQCLLNHT